jgi:hypothetical protein
MSLVSKNWKTGGSPKLTLEQVQICRKAKERRQELLKELRSISVNVLAERFGVNRSTIWAAEAYKYYWYVK